MQNDKVNRTQQNDAQQNDTEQNDILQNNPSRMTAKWQLTTC
jgi:hypothetical protein